MANLIVSYDLNGPNPSHKAVDDLLNRAGAKRGRILEIVWWVDYPGSAANLRDQLLTILQSEDRLFVAECTAAAWRNLLVSDASLKQAWEAAA